MLSASSVLVGADYLYEEKAFAHGAMKDVHMCDGGEQVVAFFQKDLPASSMERVIEIATTYRNSVFDGPERDYWLRFFCWPTDVVSSNGKIGIVMPKFPGCYFFENGSTDGDLLEIVGREKESGWYTSATTNKLIETRERGHWGSMLSISLKLARAVRRLHAAGLAHSDLSYRNVLVDPVTRGAMIIDIDGLVVPGKYPPEVSGTPDFIAPEVVSTAHLPLEDPNRVTPTIRTDRHALAVLIYCYLFRRHPLRVSAVYSKDPIEDERLRMGEKAMWIEDPRCVKDNEHVNNVFPFGSLSALPYTIAGPTLSRLFERAFGEGLADPQSRPTADEWEYALWTSCDLLRPCSNDRCVGVWFPQLDDTDKCPFCHEAVTSLPTLDLYITSSDSCLLPENRSLVVHGNGLSLYPWHTDSRESPNEFYDPLDKPPIGRFVYRGDQFTFINDKHDKMSVNNISMNHGSEIILNNNDLWQFGDQDNRRLKVNFR